MEDFYLTEHGLAGYFEAQWFDKFIEDQQIEMISSRSKQVPLSFCHHLTALKLLILLRRR
nr:hypothetical protein [Vibrio alginolyticus]